MKDEENEDYWVTDTTMTENWDGSVIDYLAKNEQDDSDMNIRENMKESREQQKSRLLAKFRCYGLPDSEVEDIIAYFRGDEGDILREITNRLRMYLENGTLKVTAPNKESSP